MVGKKIQPSAAKVMRPRGELNRGTVSNYGDGIVRIEQGLRIEASLAARF